LLVENDVIFAYLNMLDRQHRVASRIFKKLEKGSISFEMSSVSLMEMELIYKSQGRENRLLRDLAALIALPNVKYVPLTPDIALAAVYLRQNLNLSFFDSHYAATALTLDGAIASFDTAYDRVEGLKRVPPEMV